MQAGQATQERVATINALENTTSSCKTEERASRCEVVVDKTIIGTTCIQELWWCLPSLHQQSHFLTISPEKEQKLFGSQRGQALLTHKMYLHGQLQIFLGWLSMGASRFR